jgi:hypothetical protein
MRGSLLADHAAEEQIDPNRQIPPTGCRADVGDVARPTTVRRRGLEILLKLVVQHPSGASAWIRGDP